MRRGEVESLELHSLDLESGTLAVVGKGRTDPIKLTLPDPVRKALEGWLGIRGTDPGPLFHRLDRAAIVPARLSADGIHKIIGTLGKRAALSRGLAPHKLRHHACTQVLDRSNGDVQAAQRFSRHKDLRTLCK
jgi:integrase/recombinase XerC